MGRVITLIELAERGFTLARQDKHYVTYCDSKQHIKAGYERGYPNSYVMNVTYPCDCGAARLPAVHRSSA